MVVQWDVYLVFTAVSQWQVLSITNDALNLDITYSPSHSHVINLMGSRAL